MRRFYYKLRQILQSVLFVTNYVSTYVIITYRQSAKLFIAGGKMILYEEGTTQGDSVTLRWYSLVSLLLLNIGEYNFLVTAFAPILR